LKAADLDDVSGNDRAFIPNALAIDENAIATLVVDDRDHIRFVSKKRMVSRDGGFGQNEIVFDAPAERERKVIDVRGRNLSCVIPNAKAKLGHRNRPSWFESGKERTVLQACILHREKHRIPGQVCRIRMNSRPTFTIGPHIGSSDQKLGSEARIRSSDQKLGSGNRQARTSIHAVDQRQHFGDRLVNRFGNLLANRELAEYGGKIIVLAHGNFVGSCYLDHFGSELAFSAGKDAGRGSHVLAVTQCHRDLAPRGRSPA
jgi:hypothetical protein